MNWDTINRRVARAAERAPTPAAARASVDVSIYTPAECARFSVIRGRYPDCTFTPGDLWMVSDDDLDFLTETAERVKALREEQEATTA